MQVRDVAFGERDDVDAGERQPLEQAGSVFLVAAEAIERFGEDDVDLLPQCRASSPESRAHEGCAGNRVVGVLACDVPALTLRKFAADAELISDRCVTLVLGGVAGVDGNFHSRPSSTERSDSATAWSKTSRAA